MPQLRRPDSQNLARSLSLTVSRSLALSCDQQSRAVRTTPTTINQTWRVLRVNDGVSVSSRLDCVVRIDWSNSAFYDRCGGSKCVFEGGRILLAVV